MQDRTAIQPLPPTPKVELPETRGFRVKSKVLGKALHNDQLAHERLGKPTALAVFASDALSSTAYASEEILRTLLLGAGAVGLLAFSLLMPITLALVAVLVILIFSYRQTIKAYPSAGGAYIVTKDNLGLIPAQVAGVALLTDYILTVAVSVSAGVAALYSAFHAALPLPGADRPRLHRHHLRRQPPGRQGVGEALRRPDLPVHHQHVRDDHHGRLQGHLRRRPLLRGPDRPGRPRGHRCRRRS